MNEFSDAIMKDRLIFFGKSVGLAGACFYLTYKMKRMSFLNRIFFGSSISHQIKFLLLN